MIKLKTTTKFRSKIASRLLQVVVMTVGIVSGVAAQSNTGKSESFKVIGYMPSWTGSAETIPYTKFTHINYMAVRPTASGDLTPLDNPGKLKQIVSKAHSSAVKVGLVVGGWSDLKNDDFSAMAAQAATRAKFVSNILNLLVAHNLDGVDVDWKYPDAGEEADNFAALIHDLAVALHPRGKFLSAVVAANGVHAYNVQSSVIGDADFLNLVPENSASENSTFSYASSSIDYWIGRGLPASRAVLGIPMGSLSTWKSFRTLVAEGANPNVDTYGDDQYNGIYTVKQKTGLAFDRQLAGVIVSEMSNDAEGKSSLVEAIHSVVQQHDVRKVSRAYAFNGRQHKIPGVIETEHYDEGGEGIAYHDLSSSNSGGAFRNDNVDLEPIGGLEQQFKLAGIQAGEWLQYSVMVTNASPLTLEVEVAALQAGSVFHIELDGRNISGLLNVPATGGFDNWKTISVRTSSLAKGKRVLRLVIDKGNSFAINALAFKQEFGQPIEETKDIADEAVTVGELALYPNPGVANSEQVLTISFGTELEGAAIKIKNLNGMEVFSYTQEGIKDKSVELKVPALPRGLYVLTVDTGSETFSRKYLVK